MNKLILLSILQAFITIVGISAYGARLSGVKSKNLSTAFSLYNILNLGSRFANMILLPLLGSLVEDAISTNNINKLTNEFFIILFSVLAGTLLAGLFLPTFTNFFDKFIEKLVQHRNFSTLFLKEFRIRNLKKIPQIIKTLTIKRVKEYKATKLPKTSLWLNPIIVAIYTVGYLSALYAGALVPENRLVASQLSSTVNGIGTILLYLFVDPIVGIISDEVMKGKRDQIEIETMIFYLWVGRIIGVVMSFALLIPLAHFISSIAKFI